MKTFLLSLCCLVSFNALAQITTFSDRTAWEAAAGDICATEDLESFTEDTEFRTAPLQLNGFTIAAEGAGVSSATFYNIVDFPPYNTLDLPLSSHDGSSYILGLTDNGLIELNITFDQPAYGFFAEFYATADTSGEMLGLVYDAGGTMIGSYNFTMSNETYGINSSVPFTSIKLRSQLNNQLGGEGFGIDNISIYCEPVPIPTISQWGLFILGLILSSMAFAFIRIKNTVTA